MHPTSEQQRALDVFATGGSLVIEAGAGSGKTTTLEMLAKSTPRRGTYLAFNKSIADEAARRFLATVDARTMSSIAYRAMAHILNARERLGAPRQTSGEAARILGIKPIKITVNGIKKELGAGYLASHALQAVSYFCRSADEEIGARHFPRINGIDPSVPVRQPTPAGVPESVARATHEAAVKEAWANNNAIRDELIPVARKAWLDLASPTGQLRFTHDVYLKAWQLCRAKIPGDFILFDEAQDANPVMLAAVEQQPRDVQRVYVGDSQQQIYEWRGAVNALSKLDGERTFLSQSFRFGPAIAEMANAVLALLDADLRISGLDSIESSIDKVNEPDAILCRTNGGAIGSLLEQRAAGRTYHLVGNTGDLIHFIRDCGRLKNGGKATHPEIACFDSWWELVQYVGDDPNGSDLRVMVDLVNRYGIVTMLSALERQAREDAADVVVSTCHKAKGREWASVRLASDLKVEDEMTHAELRLLYVAITRARLVLDVSCVAGIEKLYAPVGGESDHATVSGLSGTCKEC